MKKKVVSLMLVAAMVASLAACGSSGSSDSSEGGGEDGERVVELWTCWTEGADTETASLEQIEKFEEETGVTVNQTNFTYDMLHEKILTAAAGGNVPDLIWGLPEYIGEFYNMGILEDLTDRFNEWEDKDALWEAVSAGEIDTIGTDHCSFHYNPTKMLGKDDFSAIPPGIPGVEHRPALIYTYGVKEGRISLVQMARLLAEQPAKLFGMYPQKGVLRVGSDADLVFFDPDHTWTITAKDQYQNVDYTPYEGMVMAGKTDTVLLNGKIAVAGGKVVEENLGRYVRRGPSQFWR